jgi:DNA transformation protein and related proteins
MVSSSTRSPAVSAFTEHCVELFSALGGVRVKRFFSGHGLYVDDLFLAFIIRERLYLKADSHTEAQFSAASCEPFVYEGKGKQVTVRYWTAPPDALDSAAVMLPWARLAMQAALRAATAKPKTVAKKKPAAKKSRV